MIDFNNPECMDVIRLKRFMTRHLNRFAKWYTFTSIILADDGLNGRIPEGTREYKVRGLIGNFSQTFRRVSTDGGTANYNQGQSLYFICMYDEDIKWQIGDEVISNNIVYFITEFINIQDLDLYYYVTLSFTDVDKEKHNNGIQE